VCEKAISRSHAVEFGPADGRVNARTSHPPCHSILLCPALDALLHVTAHRIQPPAHPVDCCPFPPRDSRLRPITLLSLPTTPPPATPSPPPLPYTSSRLYHPHAACTAPTTSVSLTLQPQESRPLCCAVLYHTRLTTRPPAAQSTSYRQFLPKPSLIRPNPAPTTHLAHPHARSQQHHQTQPASAPRPRTPNPRTCML
jgi:hypothetical protein